VPLRHWVRVTAGRDEVEAVAQSASTVLAMAHYSDSEYAALLHSPSWTRAETDALYTLAERFEWRWPVIVDRWAAETTMPPRTMEELKERFYMSQRTLEEERHRGDMDERWLERRTALDKATFKRPPDAPRFP